SKSAAIAMTKIWSAAANEVRRRFGSVSIKRTNNPKRRRRFALPAHSKSGLIFKIPSPLLPRDRRQAGDGIIFRKSRNSHCDLNTFSRAFKSCCNVRAGLLTFASLTTSEVIHSGATARDSHPLPYSPRFYAGHQNVFERSEGTNVPDAAEVIIYFPQVSNRTEKKRRKRTRRRDKSLPALMSNRRLRDRRYLKGRSVLHSS